MPFAVGAALTIEASDEHWIIDWLLDESENYDRFGMEDGGGWMARLAPLRDELLRGDLRPLYLGWLASAGGRDDEALEPQVPPGLSDLTLPQQALIDFIEVDPDLLFAAAAGSEPVPNNETLRSADIDAWLAESSLNDMAAMLKLMALGQGRDAQRHVMAHHGAWNKARQPVQASSAAQRTVGQLRDLAQSFSGMRLARDAEVRAAAEAERRLQREAVLRQLMADVDKRWAEVDALATRGSASGYAQAVRGLADLAEGYALCSSVKAFDRALRHLLVPHATRGALLRRLAEAGLWSG